MSHWCCFIPPKARKPSQSIPVLKVTTTRPTLNQGSLQDIAKNWKTDLAAVWQRPVTELPIDTDLPRICSKISVKMEGKDFEFLPDGQSTPLEIVLCKLCYAIAGEESAVDCRAKFREATSSQGEISNMFRAFLASAGLDSRVINILKLCHQKIMFPAYYYLKHCLGKYGELRDSRGKWQVDVNVTMSGEICVRHRKGQRSAKVTENGEPEFEFVWELGVLTDPSTTQLKDVWVTILDTPRFHSTLSVPQRREVIKQVSDHKLVALTSESKRRLSEMVDSLLRDTVIEAMKRISYRSQQDQSEVNL